MSLVISTLLSAVIATEPLNNRIEYDNSEELKVKIMELLREKKSNVQKPPVFVEPPKVEAPTDETPQDETYILKPAAFSLYLEKYKVEDKTVKVTINSHHDMYKFTTTMLKELPHTVHMTSTHLNKHQLKEMYEEAMSSKVEELTPTMHGLSNYSTKLTNQLVINDNANDNYNAATIQKAVEMYVKDLVPLLKGATEMDTIDNIYDFIYENFNYTANNYRNMLVGNLGSGEMACNGFSYLADQLFEEVGIDSYIRAGNSHYWNVLTLSDGREVTFDTTSDIVLDEYKATFGASTKQHIKKVSAIGFYSAEYMNGKYHEVAAFLP